MKEYGCQHYHSYIIIIIIIITIMIINTSNASSEYAMYACALHICTYVCVYDVHMCVMYIRTWWPPEEGLQTQSLEAQS